MGSGAVTARQITDLLCHCHWRTRNQVLVPNVSYGLLPWEADLVVMYASGWLEEVEVKISKADFRRDFTSKPEKHERLQKGTPKQVFQGFGTPVQVWKPDWTKAEPSMIRRFWLAMPHELALKLLPEAPAHCGVIAVSTCCVVLRPAPVLKCARKLTAPEQNQLLRLAYLRYWDLRRKHEIPTAIVA
jgi:hypothetical protein